MVVNIDDPAHVASFFSRLDSISSGATLRGGSVSTDQLFGEEKTEPMEHSPKSQLEKARNPFENSPQQNGDASLISKSDHHQNGLSQGLQQVKNDESNPVVSVACRKTRRESPETAYPSPSSTNMLDQESTTFMTPTQKKIFDTIENDEAGKAGRTEWEHEFTTNGKSVSHPIASTTPGHNVRDMFAGETYGTMSYYDNILKQQEMAVKSPIEDSKVDLDSGSLDALESGPRAQSPANNLANGDRPAKDQDVKSELTDDVHVREAKVNGFEDLANSTNHITAGKKVNDSSVFELTSNHNSAASKAVTNQTQDSSTENLEKVRSDPGIDLTPVLRAIGSRNEKQQDTRAHSPRTPGSDIQLHHPYTPYTGVADSAEAAKGTSEGSPSRLRVPGLAQSKADHVCELTTDTGTKDSTHDKVHDTSANSRTIILKGLPAESDLNLVQSLIHGGAIERMEVNVDQREATVKFVNSVDCKNFAAASSDGIKVRYHGKKHVVHTEDAGRIDHMDDVTQAYVDCGATRVVNVDGAKESMTMFALNKLAEGSSPRRAVETIVDSYRRESRNIDFRFASIKDAVSFRVQLRKDEEWKETTIQFLEDPCEVA